MLILAIDPSINNVGTALYDTLTQKLKTKLIKPSRSLAGAAESQSMVCIGHDILRVLIVEVLQGKKVDKLIIEYPQWENSERGAIAAQKGYTLDLAFIAGMVGGGFGLATNNIYAPTPMMWKGNRPKTATKADVKRVFGSLQISEHEVDAVGLILWGLEQPGIAS